jgi:hypothetical protein
MLDLRRAWKSRTCILTAFLATGLPVGLGGGLDQIGGLNTGDGLPFVFSGICIHDGLRSTQLGDEIMNASQHQLTIAL